MKKAPLRMVRSSLRIAVSAAALGLLAGCADAGGDDDAFPEGLLPPETAAPTRGIVMGEFIAHISPRSGKIEFEPVKRASPSLKTQSIDSLNIVQDDNPNSGPPTTVELITNSVGSNGQCPPGYQSNTFCGNVTLR